MKEKKELIQNKLGLFLEFVRINLDAKKIIFSLKLVKYTITLLNQLKN